MNRRQFPQQGIIASLLLVFLNGCASTTPVPVVTTLMPTSPPVVPTNPPSFRILIPTSQPTATRMPTNTVPASTSDGTVTPRPSATLPAPIERPFLMKIDRISVIVGHGTLLEGRVMNGTLQGKGAVEILGPGKDVLSPNLLAIFIANTARNLVKVGDYAGILVGGIEATDLSPGMLLVEAGEFESYEEALLQVK